MRDLHGLRVPAGAGGEDHHQGVHRADLAVRRERAPRRQSSSPVGRATSITLTPARSSPSSSGRCSSSVSSNWQSARRTSASSAVAAAGGVDAAPPRTRRDPRRPSPAASRGCCRAARRRGAAGRVVRAATSTGGLARPPRRGARARSRSGRRTQPAVVVVGALAQQLLDGLGHLGSGGFGRRGCGRCATPAPWRRRTELVPLGRREEAVRLAVEVDADAAVDVHGRVRDPVAGVGGPQLADRDAICRRATPRQSARRPATARAAAPSDVDVAVREPLRPAWKVPIGRPNCSRVWRTTRSAPAPPRKIPSCSAETASSRSSCSRSCRTRRGRPAPGRRPRHPFEIEPRHGVAVEELLGGHDEPLVAGLDHEERATPVGVSRHQEQVRVAGAVGTIALLPVSRKPSPSAVAVVVGRSGANAGPRRRRRSAPTSLAVAPARHGLFWSSVP